jgi:cell division protein FtsB
MEWVNIVIILICLGLAIEMHFSMARFKIWKAKLLALEEEIDHLHDEADEARATIAELRENRDYWQYQWELNARAKYEKDEHYPEPHGY